MKIKQSELKKIIKEELEALEEAAGNKVYVLLHQIPYEGEMVVGVYSSHELARAAAESYKQQRPESFQHDDPDMDHVMEISVFTVDRQIPNVYSSNEER